MSAREVIKQPSGVCNEHYGKKGNACTIGVQPSRCSTGIGRCYPKQKDGSGNTYRLVGSQ